MADGKNSPLPDEPSGILSFEELLRLTPEEADRSGMRGAWNIARSRQLVGQAVAETPEPPAKPPSFFISYRWESAAHKSWVARMVHDLQARGYDVYFDQDLQSDRDEPLPVPELISLLTRCNHFLFVLTKGYLERIVDIGGRIKDGWVWDEYQVAMEMQQLGRIKSFLCVWRSGVLPEWIREEQVWDFRDDERYEAQLEKAFPPRLAIIFGVRPDGTMRSIGPVERVRVTEFGRQLEATGEFDHFIIEHL